MTKTFKGKGTEFWEQDLEGKGKLSVFKSAVDLARHWWQFNNLWVPLFAVVLKSLTGGYSSPCFRGPVCLTKGVSANLARCINQESLVQKMIHSSLYILWHRALILLLWVSSRPWSRHGFILFSEGKPGSFLIGLWEKPSPLYSFYTLQDSVWMKNQKIWCYVLEIF